MRAVTVPRRALYDPSISYAELHLLGVLADIENDLGWVTHMQAEIGALINVGRTDISRRMAKLEKAGYLESRRQGARLLWRVRLDPVEISAQVSGKIPHLDADAIDDAGPLDPDPPPPDHVEPPSTDKVNGVPTLAAAGLPPGWAIPPTLVTWAAATVPTVPVAIETERWRIYHTDKRTRRVGWDGSWKDWMLRATKDYPDEGRQPASNQGRRRAGAETDSERRAKITRAVARNRDEDPPR